MNTFALNLDDSVETRVVYHTLKLSVSMKTGVISEHQLDVREHIRDWDRSDFQWVDGVAATIASVAIDIPMDELMDECIKIIQKF